MVQVDKTARIGFRCERCGQELPIGGWTVIDYQQRSRFHRSANSVQQVAEYHQDCFIAELLGIPNDK